MFGLLNINKPQKMTSHDVVAKLRKILNIKQIGHAGTLDPIATGVLPVCIGKATRLMEYLPKDKAYRAFARLGITTDSYDSEGNILEKKEVKISKEQILEELKKFQGKIIQTPPVYSAVHYKGKRLYEYARANIEVEDIPKREVEIYSINLFDINDEQTENPLVIFDVECSAGTYIRSLINDLGQNLQCGAFMENLIRTKSSGVILNDSLTFEEIEKLAVAQNIQSVIINPVEVIDLKHVEISSDELKKLQFGQNFQPNEKLSENEIILLVYEENVAGIGVMTQGLVKPQKVFS